MKLITRDTDYAVRALRYIADSDNEVVSVKEIVTELKIPKPFLRKICQILGKKGIIKSCRGKGGGFSLIVPVNKIFLVDLIKIFQGPLKINECIFKNSICPNRDICKLNKKIDNIERYVINKLKSVTIASLAKRGG